MKTIKSVLSTKPYEVNAQMKRVYDAETVERAMAEYGNGILAREQQAKHAGFIEAVEICETLYLEGRLEGLRTTDKGVVKYFNKPASPYEPREKEQIPASWMLPPGSAPIYTHSEEYKRKWQKFFNALPGEERDRYMQHYHDITPEKGGEDE